MNLLTFLESKDGFQLEKYIREKSGECSIDFKNFWLIKLIGRGAYGTVFLVRHSTD